MADFDTIYEEREDEEENIDNYTIYVPDPIIIRGAGNVTMLVCRWVVESLVITIKMLRHRIYITVNVWSWEG